MTVRELGIAFFDRFNRHDPLGASLVGLTAYDALLPDPRPSVGRAAHQFRAVARSAEAFAACRLVRDLAASATVSGSRPPKVRRHARQAAAPSVTLRR